jgi:predicted TPR repeat methyltransferase
MTDHDGTASEAWHEPPKSLLDEVMAAPRQPLPEGTTDEQVQAFLHIAAENHHSGKIEQAERMYRQLLRWQPDNPDALHLFGLLAAQMDLFDDALELMDRAIALNPSVPEYHANRGNVLKIKTRPLDAQAAFETALRLRPDFPEALMNLATLERAQGRLDESERHLHRSLELRPDYADAELNLANLCTARGRFDEATTLYQKALRAEPRYIGAYEGFARAACRAGRTEEAAAAFRHLLMFDPNNEVAQHLLAAMTGDPGCERASDAYIRRLFNDYAPHFDQSLANLNYCAPQLVAECLAGLVPAEARLEILDAGCGTGLCGPMLAPLAGRLVGVDLSSGMLAEAKKRNAYDELAESELTAYLDHHPLTFDAVVCADTLVYVGRLDAPIAAAAKSLKPNGLAIFTLEEMTEDNGGNGYSVTPHGRFIHDPTYVREILKEAGLVTIAIDPIVPRSEGGQPVHGLLVSARKPAA